MLCINLIAGDLPLHFPEISDESQLKRRQDKHQFRSFFPSVYEATETRCVHMTPFVQPELVVMGPVSSCNPGDVEAMVLSLLPWNSNIKHQSVWNGIPTDLRPLVMW